MYTHTHMHKDNKTTIMTTPTPSKLGEHGWGSSSVGLHVI